MQQEQVKANDDVTRSLICDEIDRANRYWEGDDLYLSEGAVCAAKDLMWHLNARGSASVGDAQ